MTHRASPGPSSWTPTSGLMTVPPCTSWSYWRMIHSLLHTLCEARMFEAGRHVKSVRLLVSLGEPCLACSPGSLCARSPAARRAAGRRAGSACQIGDLIAPGRTAAAGRSPRSVPMHRRLDVLARRTAACKLRPVRRRHGQHHALLRLGDPDFRVRQALVLQRRLVEMHRRRRASRPSRRPRS